MKLAAALFSLACMLATVAFPQPSAGQEPTLKWGLGTRSCAQFAKDFRDDPELWETLYYIWAEGFMTGFNMLKIAASGEGTDLNPHGRSEQWRREAIRDYCAINPLASYSEAVLNLIVELADAPN